MADKHVIASSPDAVEEAPVTRMLRAINSQVMRSNELSLARSHTIVDFDSVGTTAERMDAMLSAICEGLKTVGLAPTAAGLGIFPGADDDGNKYGTLLYYSLPHSTRSSS